MSDYKKALGKNGEDMAEVHLLKCGYEIFERNFRCRLGEIDIIARDGEYIVFIEVKTRTGVRFGMANEAVGYRKQNRLRKLASYYMSKCRLTNANCRFDVVTVKLDNNSNWGIEIIKNAF
jgi:putative endonuclease